jgi:hypothetical protein
MEYEAKALLAAQLHKRDEARKYADFFKACGALSDKIERETKAATAAKPVILRPN